ncbi:MFS transporter [Ktedonosporobacter rubrisoli]|uniref:MFS transporter n=1 Tax=Ktedonosporobacter rubrisoli TaxID=2509675 RepID=A0A4P6JP20_KTERU|nr:MFS transporter [Ktedonosporobacter rubrisoli]QBD77088.1 MFS transporter [Ktedonosporobacter rubrisoli]
MASEARTTSSTASAGNIIARQDRLQVWSLAPSFLVVIGVGFLFTFFDIFDINVSFIQTCAQIAAGCTPANASSFLGLPVLLNLVAYVAGALFLTPLADRFGRRDTLLITLLITGLGSLYTALSNDMTNFTIARAVTGIGIGADLAIVNTYINEVAPRNGRAKYTSLIFFMSALGAFLGIWVGLLLTTEATPFPLGLPFALASAAFTSGWRIMYFIGALLALIGIVLRFQLPESPRWLILRGRVDEADRVVKGMEERAARIQPLPEMLDELPTPTQEASVGYAEIFRNPLYLRRTLLLLVVWLFAYITVYTISAGLTVVLASLKYPVPEAGLITAMGTFGFLLCAVFAYTFGERLERKYWLPIGAVITLIGGIIIALGGTFSSPSAVPFVSFIGSIILFFGFNVWVPMTYAWSTENYPTRARTTGFGIVDGVGHVGAGVGLLVVAPLLEQMGPLLAMLLIAGFLVISAVIAQFGIATRGKRLDDVSP